MSSSIHAPHTDPAPPMSPPAAAPPASPPRPPPVVLRGWSGPFVEQSQFTDSVDAPQAHSESPFSADEQRLYDHLSEFAPLPSDSMGTEDLSTSPKQRAVFLRRTVAPPARQRTAHACEKCRDRKTKCSGDTPVCKRCAARGLVCVFPRREPRARAPNKPRSKPSGRRSSQSSVASSQSGTHIPAPTHAHRYQQQWANREARRIQLASTNELAETYLGAQTHPRSLVVDTDRTPGALPMFAPLLDGALPRYSGQWTDYNSDYSSSSEPPSATESNFSFSSSSSSLQDAGYPPPPQMQLLPAYGYNAFSTYDSAKPQHDPVFDIEGVQFLPLDWSGNDVAPQVAAEWPLVYPSPLHAVDVPALAEFAAALAERGISWDGLDG